jgi:GH24 family phage-related lysozyme (muramidase)
MPDNSPKAAQADNSKLGMSTAGKSRLRAREKQNYFYYDDGGKPGRGNCTWGVGTLAHRGPCTAEELKMPVSAAQVESAFASKISEAEGIIRRRVTRQQLTQDQFDALVSFVYNAGGRGARSALERIDDGDLKSAAKSMSNTIYMTVKTAKGSKRVVARGLISRRAEESAPFRSAK